MKEGRGKPAGLVADADVLIDYAESDKVILALISHHVAPLHVPSPVLAEEVRQLTEAEAVELGMVVIEPTFDQVLEARSGTGPTSFQDRICFIIARDRGWAVFTNDNALRSFCNKGNVSCMWGLKAMVTLVLENHLSAERAMRVARKIAEKNPFINETVLSRFRGMIFK